MLSWRGVYLTESMNSALSWIFCVRPFNYILWRKIKKYRQKMNCWVSFPRWWSFSSERSLNQPKTNRVCIRSTNQSNRSIFVRLLFLSCSRVFISRLYENRSRRFPRRFLKTVSFVRRIIFRNWLIWMVSFD